MKNSNFNYMIRKYSPTMLSSIAAIGVVLSTVIAVKATPKALILLKDAKTYKNDNLTKFETIKTVAPVYIPTAISCLTTIFCILGANMLNKKQQMSLISAYALLENSFKRYRKAAINVYGNDADLKIQAETAKMTYISHDGYSTYNPHMDESEQILFYDFYSDRYFNATSAAVINAQYHLNRNLSLRGYATINEFYEFLGIDILENGYEIGWDMDCLMEDGLLWLDFENRNAQLEDGMECCIVSSAVTPFPLIFA